MVRLGFIGIILLVFLAYGCDLHESKGILMDRMFVKGNHLYDQGKFAEAEKIFLGMIEGNPENPRLHNNLGNVYVREGRVGDAKRQYRKALELNPGYVIARVNLAVLLLENGDSDLARRLFQKELGRYPEHADLHNGLGVFSLRTGRVKEAVDHFRKAIDIEGEVPFLYNNLAFAYAESNEYLNEALKLAKEAVKSDPENPVFLDTMGWVYFKRGVFDNAILNLKASLQRDPTSRRTRSHLITLYRWIGRESDAADLIRDQG